MATAVVEIDSPPDLLRRFTPTPFVAEYSIGRVCLRVKTNDVAILGILPKGRAKRASAVYECTLLREDDVPTMEADLTVHEEQGTICFWRGGAELHVSHSSNSVVAFYRGECASSVVETMCKCLTEKQCKV